MKPANLEAVIRNIGRLRAESVGEDKVRIWCPWCKASTTQRLEHGANNLFVVEHEHECPYARAVEATEKAKVN